MPEDPQIHSPAANPIVLELGQPSLLASDATATSIRVQGAFVRLDPDARFNPLQFTLEALVLPEWDLSVLSNNYYCVMESSSPLPGQPNTQKRFGYAIYAGPDDPNVANSQFHWQLWGWATETTSCDSPRSRTMSRPIPVQCLSPCRRI